MLIGAELRLSGGFVMVVVVDVDRSWAWMSAGKILIVIYVKHQ